VYAQPVFATVERHVTAKWPDAKFISRVHTLNVPFFNSTLKFTLSKLTLRSIIILVTTLVAMMVPFFNAVLGLLGAFSFWPLTVYFPISMHIAQEKIGRGMPKWYFLHSLSIFCLVISIGVSIGSVVDIANSLKMSAPFKRAD
jgi:Transmembrane amino acid transporter protein